MPNGPQDKPSLDEQWVQIVELHNETKALFLFAEEIEHEQFQDFIPPISEHRHAYEHVVRAQANRLGVDGREPDEEYQRDCFNKALGHEYRAFFDCADWISVILRDEIFEAVKPYDGSCLRDVLPDYYGKYRARVMVISVRIAEIRGKKDISKALEILSEVHDYNAAIEELREIHEIILGAVPELNRYTAGERAKYRKEWIWSAVRTVIVAAIIGVCGFFLGQLTGGKTDTTPPKPKPANSDSSVTASGVTACHPSIRAR